MSTLTIRYSAADHHGKGLGVKETQHTVVFEVSAGATKRSQGAVQQISR